VVLDIKEKTDFFYKGVSYLNMALEMEKKKFKIFSSNHTHMSLTILFIQSVYKEIDLSLLCK
jgi:hypothetical protein